MRSLLTLILLYSWLCFLLLAIWKYVNCHGLNTARLSAGDSIHEAVVEPQRTWLIRLFSLLLFRAPEVHLKELEDVCTDGIVSVRTWRHFFDKLLAEWQGLIFLVRAIPHNLIS